jgi:predicted peptidase
MTQQPKTFEGQVIKTVKLGYLLYLPPDYDEHAQQKWPLVMFLHGYGERGNDLELVKKHGLAKVLETKTDFPFIAVSPQCPGHSWWPLEVDALNGLLDSMIEQYPVDTNRVYLTGLSMGGFGTWSFATLHPERFAAIAPICGGGVPPLASALKHVPVWAFHGAEDDVVPLAASQVMVDSVLEAGGNARLTVYPDVGHDSWTQTYDNPELYTWLLSHSLEA